MYGQTLFLIVSVFPLVITLGVIGPFKAKLISASKDPSIHHPKMSFNVRMSKISKVDTAMFVNIKVLEEVGPVWMQLKIEKYGNGGYKTWLLDDGWKSVACENMFFNKMIQAFKATAYITKECNITKGAIAVKNFMMDEEVHNFRKTIVYGKYKVSAKLTEADGTPLFNMLLEISFDPL